MEHAATGCAEDTKVKTLLLASSCLVALCASAQAAPKMLTAQCTETADHVRTCLAPGEAPISPEHLYPPDQAIAQAPVGPLPPPPPMAGISGVLCCWCSMGVAKPEGCAQWPGSDALASRNAADGVQYLRSLGLCADRMGLSGLGILALCALLGFLPVTSFFPS